MSIAFRNCFFFLISKNMNFHLDMLLCRTCLYATLCYLITDGYRYHWNSYILLNILWWIEDKSEDNKYSNLASTRDEVFEISSKCTLKIKKIQDFLKGCCNGMNRSGKRKMLMTIDKKSVFRIVVRRKRNELTDLFLEYWKEYWYTKQKRVLLESIEISIHKSNYG